MTGRRKSDKWSRWILAFAVIFLIVFVSLSLFGLRIMFKEIKEITKGQQELILSLTIDEQKKYQPEQKTEESKKESHVTEMEFKRYIVENEREINQLKQEVQKLQYQVKTLKRGL